MPQSCIPRGSSTQVPAGLSSGGRLGTSGQGQGGGSPAGGRAGGRAPASGTRRRPDAQEHLPSSPFLPQVRRSSYHDVVRASDVCKLADISGIQAYTINGAR